MEKQFLGDGVYVTKEADHIVLTTENGIETTNRIVIERYAWAALVLFVGADTF
jgi:hypothetical protein